MCCVSPITLTFSTVGSLEAGLLQPGSQHYTCTGLYCSGNRKQLLSYNWMGCSAAALHQWHCKTGRAPSGLQRAGWAHCSKKHPPRSIQPIPDASDLCCLPVSSYGLHTRTTFFLQSRGSQEGSHHKVLLCDESQNVILQRLGPSVVFLSLLSITPWVGWWRCYSVTVKC